MSLNSIQRELLRTEIVRTADLAAPQEVTLRVLQTYIRPVFPKATEEALAAEVQYLVDKGFLRAAEKAISPENKAWHVTADGRDWLAEQGLA